MKTKHQFLLTITVDDNVATKYPNYRFNYDTVKQFVAARIADIKDVGGEGDFGYKITVKEQKKEQ